MRQPVLHYFYDPFCGWCYGAAPLVSMAQTLPGLSVQAHGVGMLTGTQAKWMDEQWREFVRPHEKRIHDLSGQSFGEAYVEGAQMRTDLRLDSAPPIAAMLAADRLKGRGVEMLKQLQERYYQQGLPIAEREQLVAAAEAIGLDSNAFVDALEGIGVEELQDHFKASKDRLAEFAAKGFPVFALEIDGQFEVLPLGRYLGRPEKFYQALSDRLV